MRRKCKYDLKHLIRQTPHILQFKEKFLSRERIFQPLSAKKNLKAQLKNLVVHRRVFSIQAHEQ